MKILRVTDKEADLIETIRNYKRSFPAGHPHLLEYARELFDDLTECYYD